MNGDEIRDLLSAAGFELQEAVATASPRAFLLRRNPQPKIRCDYLAPGII
jgi:hypothetical protein